LRHHSHLFLRRSELSLCIFSSNYMTKCTPHFMTARYETTNIVRYRRRLPSITRSLLQICAHARQKAQMTLQRAPQSRKQRLRWVRVSPARVRRLIYLCIGSRSTRMQKGSDITKCRRAPRRGQDKTSLPFQTHQSRERGNFGLDDYACADRCLRLGRECDLIDLFDNHYSQ
jgi:hypothetical protein